MFEVAELGHTLSKKEYKAQVPELREQLLLAQIALREAGIPLYVLIEGPDSTSKGEVVNLLNQWFDTRGLEVNGFGPKTDEEATRPRFWRYWRNMPARGRIGLFYGSWYTGALLKRATGKHSQAVFDAHIHQIKQLENMLATDDALILKFWLHTSEKCQAKKRKSLEQAHKEGWIGAKADYEVWEHYRHFVQAAERAVRKTDHVDAPWYIVDAEDEYYRDVSLVRKILQAVERKLAENASPECRLEKESDSLLSVSEMDVTNEATVLDRLDLSKHLERSDYDDQLAELQSRLQRLSWQAYHQGVSVILVFEGWDAAGKGGAIRRIMQSVDARIARVISIAAPTDEEKSHHYLWRFWRHLPQAGRHTIYDRSWYGRVLVERVEGFAEEREWRRAYSEINAFEEQICGQKNLLLKFWLHIDPDEQLQRFQARELVPYKNYKITEEDWRNRDRWQDYVAAVHEMVTRTSTDYAPWSLVPANHKHYARIAVLATLCDALEERLAEQSESH